MDITPSRNREALVKTIQSMGRKALWLGGVTVILILLSGAAGGLSRMSESHSQGWGSVFFLFGAAKTLSLTVPAGVLLYIGFTLLVGMVVFVWNRWGNSRNAPRS